MYARMVTTYVKPNKLTAMSNFYQNTLLPLIEHHPGFKGIFVFNKPEEDKEISVTIWEHLADMQAFDWTLVPLQNKITPLLAKAPEVEIFQVVLPRDPQLAGEIALSEAFLGIRIEDPFSTLLS